MTAGVTVAAVVVLLAGATGCLHLGLGAGQRAARDAAAGATASTPPWLSGIEPARWVAGAVTVFAVLLATRWLALSIAAGALVVLWDRLARDRRGELERARLAGIAKWLEDLRDALRASSISAEEALDEVAGRPPAAIEAAMAAYVVHRHRGARAEEALVELAEDLAHPLADAATVAIRMVIGGSSGAARLHDTVTALAATARDEVRARERIDRTRRTYRDAMVRLVLIGAGIVAFLRWRGGDLLDPYSTTTGQLVLVVPVASWAGCVAWLHRLCRYRMPTRHRIDAVGALA